MQGVITSRDVLRHGVLIVRLWGPGAYARCVLALGSGRRTTFLQVVCAGNGEPVFPREPQ